MNEQVNSKFEMFFIHPKNSFSQKRKKILMNTKFVATASGIA